MNATTYATSVGAFGHGDELQWSPHLLLHPLLSPRRLHPLTEPLASWQQTIWVNGVDHVPRPDMIYLRFVLRGLDCRVSCCRVSWQWSPWACKVPSSSPEWTIKLREAWGELPSQWSTRLLWSTMVHSSVQNGSPRSCFEGSMPRVHDTGQCPNIKNN